MGKNPCAKTRDVNEPYEIWVGSVSLGGEPPVEFEWRVLKKYQTPENEAKNPYARWFLATRSPYTHGRWEYGDGYCNDNEWDKGIKSLGRKLTPEEEKVYLAKESK